MVRLNRRRETAWRCRAGRCSPNCWRRIRRRGRCSTAYGLSGCGGRLGPGESIEFFARTHGVEERRLLRELRQAVAGEATATTEQPSAADTIYQPGVGPGP